MAVAARCAGLPDDTRIYCGHEYTQANVRFARTIEPDNRALAAREQDVKGLLTAGKPTIPSTIGEEKAANPFLRADLPEVAASVGLAGGPAWKVFAEKFASARTNPDARTRAKSSNRNRLCYSNDRERRRGRLPNWNSC